MSDLRIGGLFEGYGGLTQGVQAVLGGRHAWYSEIDPGACRILEHRYPDVPNLGDITTVDWSAVEPVDVLTGGFPCQDVSAAGKRAGLMHGTRSGLWHEFARAIEALRPRLIVAENVRGLLSARGDTSEEYEAAEQRVALAANLREWLDQRRYRAANEGRTADAQRITARAHRVMAAERRAMADRRRAERRIIRAIGTVLGTLADLGYDARWCGLRAADVGAPHGRFRVFIIAYPADTRGQASRLGTGLRASEQAWLGWGRPDDGDSPRATADADRTRSQGAEPAPRRDVPAGRTTADTDLDRREGLAPLDGTHRGMDEQHRHDVDRRDPAAADPSRDGRHERRAEPTRLERRPDAAECCASAADADDRDGERGQREPVRRAQRRAAAAGRGEADSGIEWGPYRPAIERWQRTLGRPAPAPTEPGAKGGQRLSPRFVEWLMGLPAGWVTDVPDLPRNAQLKALGNGVVPQQAAASLAQMLGLERAEASAVADLLPTPCASETRGQRDLEHRMAAGSQMELSDVVRLLPTPAVNDMGAGKTPDAWDEWTDAMRAKHGNGNGHGNSLAIEAQRLAGEVSTYSTRNGAHDQ